MDADRRRWSPTVVTAGWVATRMVFVLLYTRVIDGPEIGGVFGDVELYHRWSDTLLTGQIPGADPMWQYPPGAAGLFLGIRVLADSIAAGYVDTFFAVALVADLVVLLALLRLARGDGRLLGAGVWVAVVPLLSLLTYARYDILVAATAVLALAATIRRPVVAGAAMAVGGLVKLWPVLLLISARPLGGLRPLLAGFGAGLALLGGALTIAFTGAWQGFTGNQADRGLQVESVGATPLVLARLWDASIPVSYVYGANEFDHPFVRVATVVLPVVSVVGLGGLGLWWLLRGRRLAWSAAVGFDVALLAVLVSVATSRVFSPQYLLWLIATAAVCLTRRDTSQRATSALIIAATVLTSAFFPWHYDQVTGEPAWPGSLLLVGRNVLVVIAVAVGLTALLRRAGRDRPAVAGDGGGTRDAEGGVSTGRLTR